jgi:hypothetical protein
VHPGDLRRPPSVVMKKRNCERKPDVGFQSE